MEFTAEQIAGIIGAVIVGDPNAGVDRLAKIEDAGEGSLAFLGNPKYLPYIYTTAASIVIVSKDFEPEQKVNATMLKVANPHAAFASLLAFYNEIKLNKTGISEKCHISPTAKIGKDVYIGEFAVISDHVVIGDGAKIYPQVYLGDNVQIGEKTTLFAGVKINAECIVGKNCILHPGVAIGGDGFGFAQDTITKVYHKIPQIGNVIIGDDVEIGSNTTVDRATLGSTIIGNGVKLDNLVQVAHNVEIGENTIVVAQAGIAGSAKVGKNCQVGGQAGIVGHISIADNVRIQGQSGVEGSVKEQGSIVMGAPAFEYSKYRRAYVHFRNLSELEARVRELEKKIAGTGA